jgi:hypothetical protein
MGMPYLQEVRGRWRVKVEVPDALQAHLPPPHVGKKNLTKALKTGNEREATRLAVPWIAEFQGIIAATEARTRGLSELAEIDGMKNGGLLNTRQFQHASGYCTGS